MATTRGVAFIALAIVWTWPLVTDLSGVVPGVGPGDNMAFFWNFWWVRTALADHLDVFNTAFLFAPGGAPLTQHTLTLLPAWIGATVLAPFSTAAALNITIIASLALNGFCASVLAFRLCGDRAAAMLGGLIFFGSSYFSGHLYGHFNLTTAWTVPLFALAILEALRGNRAWAVAAGVVLGVTIYIDYYYLILQAALGIAVVATTMCRWSVELRGPRQGAGIRRSVATLAILDLIVIAAIAWSGGFTLDLGRRVISMRSLFNPLQLFWLLAMTWAWLRFGPRIWPERNREITGVTATALIAAAVFAVVASPVLVRGIELITEGDYVTQTYFWRSAPEGVDLATLAMGPPFHGLLGKYVSSAYESLGIDAIEAGAWLGIVPTVLVVMALRRRGDSAVVRQWSLIGVAFVVWSFGSHLYALGANTGMILPGAFLRFIPIVNNARMPGRAMVIVALATAVLSAVAAMRWRESGRRGSLAIAGLAFLFVIESIPSPFPLARLPVPAIYQTLRDRPERGAVLELPVGIRDGFGGRGKLNDMVLYFQALHGRPIVGGFLARLPRSLAASYASDPLLNGLLTLSEGGADPAPAMPDLGMAAMRLKANGIAFVVLDRATAPAALVTYVEHVMPLALVEHEGERSLYVVK